MNKYTHAVTLLIGVSFLLSSVVGCGGQPGRLSPKAAVAEAYAATTAIRSMHYTITGAISASGEVQEIDGEGDILLPDRERVKMGMAGETVEIVCIGDKQYFKSSEAVEWQVYEPGSESQSLPVEPMDTLGYLQSVAAVTQLSDETVAGVMCGHYQSVIDVAQHLATMEAAVTERADAEMQQGWQMVRERLEDASVTVEVWIGKEDHLVYQEKLDMKTYFTPPTPAHGPPAERITITSTATIRFSKFNQPLEIEPPF